MPGFFRAPLEFWAAQRLATRILLVFLPLRTLDYTVSPAAHPNAVDNDLLLTSQMQSVFAALDENDGTVTSVYMGTESGIMQVYPSTEGLPAAFDHRERPWYRAALQSP